MKLRYKIVTLIVFISFFAFFSTNQAVPQQDFNPYLTPEQQSQLEQYRKVLEDELIKPIELEIELENYTIDSIKGLIDWLDRMANHTRMMYSPVDSPFNMMTAESSNDKFFTATADKNAIPDTYPINIIQVAKSDLLISEPVKRDQKFDKAEFVIVSGEKEDTIKFRGGNIKALERALNKYGEEIITARTIRKDLENYILAIEGIHTGESNRLMFFGDVTPLQQIGMLYGNPSDDIDVPEGDEEDTSTDSGSENEMEGQPENEDETTDETPSDPSEENLINANAIFELKQGNYTHDPEEMISLNPRTMVEFALPEPFEILPDSFIEVKIKSGAVQVAEGSDGSMPSESDVGAGDTQELEVDNVGVIEEPYNDPFLPIPLFEDSEAGEKGTAYLEAFKVGSDVGIKLYTTQEITDEDWINVKISLNEYFEEGLFIEKLLFLNNLFNKSIQFTDLRIYSNYEEPEEDPEEDPTEDPEEDNPLDELEPEGNYQRRGRNAILDYGGVEIIRESNEIKDLIEGVTLRIKRPTEQEEELKVDHDYEKIINYLVDFIDYNNLVATYIYNVVQFDKDKTEDDLLEIYRGEGLTKDEYDEAKLYGEAYERLLYGDRDVEAIKTGLRRLMTGTYETELGMDLTMLMNLGITNKEYDYTLQNPLLEVDEEELKDMLQDEFDAVKEFFYKDTNEDNLVDAGLAPKTYNFLERYRQRRVVPEEGRVYPGPLYGKIEVHRNRINNQLEEELDKAKEELEKEIDEMKEEFLKINQAKAEQENMSNMFNNSGGNATGGQ